ncbi:chaplin [Streptomyces pactum]|uniref:Chaplin n=1 Tax=Streptomyces pactum TaxID=68249 RepID=A0ABS0NHK5_9ACTN|nr:chaplin [Streptomyces pactum]MBH5334687.1 chaplin [Streptomyces pactum]
MKRLSKAVVLTATAGITVLGAAGGAVANDGGHGHHGKKPQGKHQTENKSKDKKQKDVKFSADHKGSGAKADAVAVGSPGVISGNVIQVPVKVPVNVCGNTIAVLGALNGSAGNVCINH